LFQEILEDVSPLIAKKIESQDIVNRLMDRAGWIDHVTTSHSPSFLLILFAFQLPLDHHSIFGISKNSWKRLTSF